jgi:hypothetical protein
MNTLKHHFLMLFDRAYRWWTVAFFVAGCILVALGNIMGISDNLPGITLLYSGMILLFLAFIHPWKKPVSFGIFSAAIVTLLVVLILLAILYFYLVKKIDPALQHSAFSRFIDGGLEFFALIIFIPGLATGLLGAIFRTIQGKLRKQKTKE